MKTETIGYLRRVAMLVLVALATCGLAATASAQSFTGRFKLPYEAHWGAATLPAGEYTITVDSFRTATLVQSATNSQSFYTRLPIIGESDKGPAAHLIVMSVQGELRIQSLNLPQTGKALVYERLSKAEQERLAKAGEIQTVPVFVARK